MHLKHDIAGFDRRFFSFFIDAILLCLLSTLIFLFIDDYYYHKPILFTLLGFGFVSLYFGFLDSTMTKGRSIGKSLLGIRVVKTNNTYLPVIQSLIRALIFLFPICLSSLFYWVGSFPMKVALISVLTVIGASLFYLFIFNRNTKQSLHDLLVNSVVIDSRKAPAERETIWKYHFLFLIVFIAVILFLRLNPLFQQNNDPMLHALVDNIQSDEQIVHVRAKNEIDNTEKNIAMNIYVNDPSLVNNVNFQQKLENSVQQQNLPNVSKINAHIYSVGQFGLYVVLHQKDLVLSHLKK